MVAPRLTWIAVPIFAVVTSLHSRSWGPAPPRKARERGKGLLCLEPWWGAGSGRQRGVLSLETPYIFFSAWKGMNGEGKKRREKPRSKVLHKEESDKYGGDILMYGRGAFKMAQGVGD